LGIQNTTGQLYHNIKETFHVAACKYLTNITPKGFAKTEVVHISWYKVLAYFFENIVYTMRLVTIKNL